MQIKCNSFMFWNRYKTVANEGEIQERRKTIQEKIQKILWNSKGIKRKLRKFQEDYKNSIRRL